MLKEEGLEGIKKKILEVKEGLKTSLKQEIEKELREKELVENENSEEINKLYCELCLRKAQACKKIESDLPDSFASSAATRKQLDSIRIKLAKFCAFSIDKPSDEEQPEYVIYTYVKEFLTYPDVKLIDSDKEKILDLLDFLLGITFSVKFNKKHAHLFSYFNKFIERNKLSLAHCLTEIDGLKKLEYFSEQTFFTIKCKFYAVIRAIDASIIYNNLLTQIASRADKEFSDNETLKTFITCFVDQCNDTFSKNQSDNFDSAILLLYQALSRKRNALKTVASTSSTSTAGSALLRNIEENLQKLRSEPELKSKPLEEFKISYEQKTGNKFLEGSLKEGNFSKGMQLTRIDSVEINHYFLMKEINRCPLETRKAFDSALKKYEDNLLFSDNKKPRSNIEESKFRNLKGALFKKIGERKETIIANLHHKIGPISADFLALAQNTAEKVKNSVESFRSSPPKHIQPPSILFDSVKKEITSKLTTLNDRLNQLVFQLNFHSLLKIRKINNKDILPDDMENIMDRGEKISYFSSFNDKNLFTLQKIIKVEKDINSFYSEIVNKFIETIQKIKHSDSWFENTDQAGSAEKIFKRGYLFKKHLKLDKLKREVGKKINFTNIKSFFLKQHFFSLLSYRIIRWPWMNKDDFAASWTEQLIFLKAIDDINEKNYKSEDLSNVIEIYHQVISNKKEGNYSIAENFHQYLINNITGYKCEIDKLLIDVNNLVPGYEKKPSSPASVQITASNHTNPFFNSASTTNAQTSSSALLIKSR